MTRRDYEILAEIFYDLWVDSNITERYTVRKTIDAFMMRAKLNNPRFNESKFLDACGVE